jgi:spermidine synthase
MGLWFTEHHTENARFSIKVNKLLYSDQSEFQRIDVYNSPEFGNFFTLDGYIMLTESYFSYLFYEHRNKLTILELVHSQGGRVCFSPHGILLPTLKSFYVAHDL